MTDPEAIAIVAERRAALGIDAAMQVASAEKAIVEHTSDRSRPAPAGNRVAWIVMLSSPMGYVMVRVDDRTGEILEVIRKV